MATLVTYTVASVTHTQQVIGGLQNLGVTVRTGDWLRVAVSDWLGLYLYGVVIAIGLGIAFTLMSFINRKLSRNVNHKLGKKAAWLFPLGGALAIWVILFSMKERGSIIPIAGARGTVGLLLQCAAGLIGGMTYVWMKKRANPFAPRDRLEFA